MADEHYFRGNGKTCGMCGLYPHAPTHVQEPTDEQVAAAVEAIKLDLHYWRIFGTSTREHVETVLAALRDVREDLRAAHEMHQEEYTVVDRVWKALNITDYEGAQGKSVDEIVKALREERDALRAALGAAKRLSDALDVVHADSRYQSVWTMYAVRGARYQGPTYGVQHDDLKSALASTPEEPS